jgi:hypothetical protein
MDDEIELEIQRNWQEPYGDRRQEIVIIGNELDKAARTEQLDWCLLTDAELQKGKAAWAKFRDPFAEWAPASLENHEN